MIQFFAWSCRSQKGDISVQNVADALAVRNYEINAKSCDCFCRDSAQNLQNEIQVWNYEPLCDHEIL